jgi:hypothetical protein
LTENFHLLENLCDYQLAALCLNYNVNLEIFDHHFIDKSVSEKSMITATGSTRFLYNESYSTIMIARCGYDFLEMHRDTVTATEFIPQLFYSVLERSTCKSKTDRLFKDEQIFYTIVFEESAPKWEPHYDESLVKSWDGCIFEVLCEALKSHNLIDICRDTQWLLSQSRHHILNMLERVDGDNLKVFQNIFIERFEQLSPTEYLIDPLCIQLNNPCGGRDIINSNIEYRKLFSYYYLVHRLRSLNNFGTIQLAALCHRFEINIMMYTHKTVDDGIQLECSGTKYYYGKDFIDIVIVNKNDRQYGFQDYRKAGR